MIQDLKWTVHQQQLCHKKLVTYKKLMYGGLVN